jgi:hypothetical protein
MKEIDLKPLPILLAKDIMNNCWARLFKAFNGYTNASTNPALHFSDEVWDRIIKITDELIDEFPFVLTINICYAYIQELSARDLGGYKDPYNSIMGDDAPLMKKIKFFKELKEMKTDKDVETDGFV